MDRRDFLRLAGIGGVVFASGLATKSFGSGFNRSNLSDDFYFVQLSDTHWGFEGDQINPDSRGTLKKAVSVLNSLDRKPDFVVFTGDLTHISEDKNVRRQRMNEFKEIISGIDVKTVRLIPGEHDASLDGGDMFQELFGKTHYSFQHKGLHFITLDNVSDPKGAIGDEQIGWLKSELSGIKKGAPVVILTHRPLFPLYPQWDWTTSDGAPVIDALKSHDNVTVFYGHIHQEHHYMTGHIAHHAARSLMFPLPAPGSVPKRVPVKWDASHPYSGLGFREVGARSKSPKLDLIEIPLTES